MKNHYKILIHLPRSYIPSEESYFCKKLPSSPRREKFYKWSDDLLQFDNYHELHVNLEVFKLISLSPQLGLRFTEGRKSTSVTPYRLSKSPRLTAQPQHGELCSLPTMEVPQQGCHPLLVSLVTFQSVSPVGLIEPWNLFLHDSVHGHVETWKIFLPITKLVSLKYT